MQRTFLKNVAILASGTVLAQAVFILVSPILTRLYSPQDFGLFAVFMALVSTLVMAACGKFEIATVVPKSNLRGKQLLGIALWFALATSLAYFLFLTVFGADLLDFLEARSLGYWIYLVPVALFFTCTGSAMAYYANRHKHYGRISKAKILAAFLVAAITITLGLIGAGFEGLVIGSLLGVPFTFFYLFNKYKSDFPLRVLKWRRAKSLLVKRYKNYPLFSASTSLLNGIQWSLPVFFLAHYFPESIVGYFALMLRVANAPLHFLASSIGMVNLKKIVDLANEGKPIIPFLLRLTSMLFLIVLVYAVILVIWAPEIFAFIFGEEWRAAGFYLQLMFPGIAVRFVGSTLSGTLGARQNNKTIAFVNILLLVATFTVFFVLSPLGDEKLLLKGYSATLAFSYFVVAAAVFVVNRESKKRREDASSKL